MVGVTSDRTRPAGLGRRRPTGEAPPLPRHVSRSTQAFVGLAIGVGVLWVALLNQASAQVVTTVDEAVLDAVARLRTDVLDDAMKALHAVGSEWTVRLLGWPMLVMLLAVRRFQHLVTLLVVTMTVGAMDAGMAVAIGRMRPTDPSPIGSWSGYAHPSMPVVMLGLAVVGVLYTLVPAGAWRNRAAVVGVVVVGLAAFARVYLAVDHPTDVVAAMVTGMAVPAAAFRLLVPDDVMPVVYRRGRRAHLDVGGRRGEGIATALRTQLGLELVQVEPFALSGSAGSTPVHIVVKDGTGERSLFGKVYANVHLRSDRWYKLARTVMYGRLEDERSFNTVRRLVEYEDHMLRVARDAGLPTAEPYGFVEITPEREYLLVTEFLDGVSPCNAETVDDAVIDDALRLVRRMWDTGLAHRDIKPANLLVRDGRVFVIDLAFAALRPSPWRQAVDLANMMVTLAVFTTPERVYQRALAFFSPDEIAEAFAASRGATIPTQLRTIVKEDGRHVATRLRELAPARPPVSIQRWTVRRIGLTLAVAAAVIGGASLFFDYLQVTGLR